MASLEAMLFAAGDPVEPGKLAEVLDVDVENVIKMLGHLEAMYDENNRGLRLIRVDGKYQLCTREEYADEVRGLLEIKKNTPLSQAAFEVLAIVAYNKTVTRSFIEQIPDGVFFAQKQIRNGGLRWLKTKMHSKSARLRTSWNRASRSCLNPSGSRNISARCPSSTTIPSTTRCSLRCRSRRQPMLPVIPRGSATLTVRS